jgi:transposase
MEPQDASTEVAAPTPRMKSPDRSQIVDPKRIDDLIPPGHKARLVWELAQELDLSPLYAQIKAVEGHAGRAPVDPRVLVALWLYAIDEGISEARELYRRCYDCDPYKWLRGGVDVNYHTLSDFRTQHPEWLQAQVVAHIAALRAEGLASLDVLGQDGMRVRATKAAKCGGVVHKIWLLVCSATSVAATPPNSTVAPAWNSVPDRVTRVPPSTPPSFGDTEERLGVAATTTL